VSSRAGSRPNGHPEPPRLLHPHETVEGEDKLLQAFFDHAAIGLAILGENGRLLKVNPALADMLGYADRSPEGLSLENLMAPEHWGRLAALINEIKAGNRTQGRITLECRHRKGMSIRGLIHLSMLVEQSTSRRQFLFQIQDISTLIRTEAELEGSRQRYRALADATFEAVFISKNGVCIDANQTASTMFQIPREKLIGIFGTDVIAEEYRERVKANMLSGHERPYHAIAVKSDDTRFHVMIQGKMIRIGTSEMRVTVVRDIDAQVRAQTALKESERHLRALMESASNFVLFRLRHHPDNPCQPECILISPSIGEIVDQNHATDFQSWIKMIHPDDKEKLLSAGRRMLESYKLDETIRIADHSGSSWRWLHIICTAVCDESDDNLFFNGIILDISGEMEAVSALKASERELKERTESLSELNTALEVLLEKREADRVEVEEKILTNARSLILPYLDKLKSSRMDARQRVYLDLMESNINEILSPLSRRMSRHFMNFTPLEIQVANLVKAGKTTKDIALILGLSVRTIEAVRYTIRRKLGIKKKRANLRSYLLSIDTADTGAVAPVV
jgi:PAS domain S-box-containing protein